MRNWFSAWFARKIGGLHEVLLAAGPNADGRCRILIATDHAILGKGLKLVIEDQPEMVVVGIVQDGAEILRHAEYVRPDVVIIDQQLRNPDGDKVLKRVMRHHADTPVIAMSAISTRAAAQEARKHGALGFVGKRHCATAIVEAVRTVHEGRHYVKW